MRNTHAKQLEKTPILRKKSQWYNTENCLASGGSSEKRKFKSLSSRSPAFCIVLLSDAANVASPDSL